MRFTTIFASIFLLLASSVTAQNGDSSDVESNELLAELAQLPECAVSERILLLRLLLLITELVKLMFYDPDDLHSNSSASFAMCPNRFRMPLHRRRIYLLQRAMHPCELHNSGIFV
jgi:hypothetical protein